MDTTTDQKYFNFPINLLRGAFDDIKGMMDNVMDYACYSKSQEYVIGTPAQKMKDAANYFGITLGNAKRSNENGRTLFYSKLTKSPMTGINKDILFDFYKNEKTESDIAVLVTFLALKSVIGSKPFVHITNEFLIARMAGYASVKSMPEVLPEPLSGYTTRRKLNKIKFELRANWNVNIYGYRVRGFYVSIENQFSLEKLIYEVEKRRKTAIEKKLRQKQNDAIMKAKTKLKNELANV
jgi:hypothetical protein